jgi:phage gp29-like protein
MAKEKRNATIAWLERSNPLKGLSISAANNIFDAARTGDTQRLHWMYQEIETANPVLSMCVTRRSGAAANFRWKVSERAAFDDTLASEQRDAVERFLGGIVNLADVFEHLDLALFRGFSHAQPIWEEDGTVHEIALLDSWKFLKKDGAWFYNPACDGFTSSCESCEDARLITVERRRPVDVPALALHLRAAVGSRDWGRFIERYALPKPAVVMSPNASGNDRNDYQQTANALENGQVTVWPSGTSLMDFAGGSRGVDPFTAFITHQEKTILMLATGGTLGSMAEAGSGTLAGNAQQDVWKSIVSRDSGVISAAMMRDLIRPYLEATFPGQKIAIEFGFDLTHNPTPKEVFEIAGAAKAAGYIINQEQLEEKTGFRLEKAPESAPMGGGMMLNRRDSADTPLQNAANRLQNASTSEDEQVDPSNETPSQTAEKRPNKQLKKVDELGVGSDGVNSLTHSLTEALEDLFEKSLAEAAAEELEMKGNHET